MLPWKHAYRFRAIAASDPGATAEDRRLLASDPVWSAAERTVKVGAPITDITADILACMGIFAAVRHRNQTGE